VAPVLSAGVDFDVEFEDDLVPIEDPEDSAFRNAEAIVRDLVYRDLQYEPYTHNFHTHAENASVSFRMLADPGEMDDMCLNGCGYMGEDVEEHMTKCVAFKCTLCHVHAIGPIFGTTEREQSDSAIYLQWNERHNIECPRAADKAVERKHGRAKRGRDKTWRTNMKKQCINQQVAAAYPIYEPVA